MQLFKQINLRMRIFSILTALVLVTLAGGFVMVWYTYRMEGILNDIIDKDMAAFQAAEALETALVNQKGFVSYYLLDRDPYWLRELGKYRQIFQERLNEVRSLEEKIPQIIIVDEIESEYIEYINLKDQVLKHYTSGDREKGARLHIGVRDRFFKILDLCEEYKNFHKKRIREAKYKSHVQARQIRLVAGTALCIVISLFLLLTFVLTGQILGPIRRLAFETNRKGAPRKGEDEVKALSKSVSGMIEEIDHTHSELEKSREHLVQAEKMALVGKLAAGMAHSIRNPLTSVKMRLFSLSRAIEVSSIHQDDFNVISEEMHHIDTIVQNFLEFSRPPKLKMQRISPSEVVDMTIQLLRHRLESYDVDVKRIRQKRLPEIQIDPEQLKEVFANLVENACESMERGGSIVIAEKEIYSQPLGRVAEIRFTDNGPGIPGSIKDNIFQPFFTTKEEGTGLGLSIVSRIVEEHGGRISLISEEELKETTFVITLPIKE